MTTDIIRTENISKHYKDVCAVSDMSLNVRKGEIYGFLGLNGAGKTTTIRMLLGMIRPTSGAAYINEKKVSADNTELWKHIGSLVEVPFSYPELTVWENLEIFRRLRFISDKKSIDEVIEKLQLGSYANRKAKNLSLGNNQRLGLAKALIHNPEILILDEPTNGLDPAGIYEIREMLKDLAINQGVTIFISSHILGEVSRFATRIGIIHEGKLTQELDTSQLEALCNKRLLINANDIEKAYSLLAQKGYFVEKTIDNQIEIKNEEAITKPDTIATIMVNADCPPTLLKVEEEDLETYFLRTIGMKGSLK
ncbi:MAG: bacitracin ABC transporter ATP-binding protein [Bacteroidetes bacterium HGW-Bacteroidetes-6]|jgi:ABC-2 type transport system ATP-binding protein|nr:MAG: bacitracin ABC transporter ATP-binding protein [Bacteroidetes bacterium HGW-Bacteroidetes-6]